MTNMTLLVFAASLALRMSPDAATVSSVRLSPNPPIVGVNTLELTILNSAGVPVNGLNLMSSVGMTSMDMGTLHPTFKGMGNGHYIGKVVFSMAGPWRVTISSSSGPSVSAKSLDFDAGAKKAWQALTEKAPEVSTRLYSHLMVGAISTTKPPPGSIGMAMEMGDAAKDMPKIGNGRVVRAPAMTSLEQNAGFGANTAMVDMMNEMMVGGSGMESMKMAPMSLKFNNSTYASPVELQRKAAQRDSDRLRVSASLNEDRRLNITLKNIDGKPVTGAKILAFVSMSEMDMGISHPVVTEVGKGRYSAAVNFGMAGSWSVVLTISDAAEAPITKSFKFLIK
jgi:hypothetical protein